MRNGRIQKRYFVLIVFFYMVLTGSSFCRPLVIQVLMDKGMINRNIHIILIISGSLLVIALIEEIVTIFQTVIFVNLRNQIVLYLYTKVFRKLLYCKMSYFLKNNTAEIINKISTDIRSVSVLVDSSMLTLISYVFQIISGVIGLIVINWKLALLVLGTVPLKYLTIRYFSKEREETTKEWIQEGADFSAWLDDAINGVREIKLWNRYKQEVKEIRNRQNRVLKAEKKNVFIDAFNNSGDSLVQWIVTSTLYGLGGVLICDGNLTIGGLTAFITYSGYVTGPISLVMNIKIILAQVKPSLERLQTFLKMETERYTGTKRPISEFSSEICFQGVSFTYEKNLILKNVNLKIGKGEKIAIIGENGSGKTTLIHLILQLLQPIEGQITLDGRDIRQYSLDEYRDLFAVVNQEIRLFRDTLKANMTMGRQVDGEDIDRICKEFDMQEFVDKQPQKYETLVEKNGGNFSGGERQKIAILRAIMKNAPIIILDEATANIDREYSRLIQEKILRDDSEKTVICITHKMENLQGMDRIYQIKNGKLESLE